MICIAPYATEALLLEVDEGVGHQAAA